MKRKLFNLNLQDKIPCSEIRDRIKTTDIKDHTLKQKWKRAGHIARMKENRWTKLCREWQPGKGKKSRGLPSRRPQDDNSKEGLNHLEQKSNRQRTMEGTDGALHPALDGQSPGEK